MKGVFKMNVRIFTHNIWNYKTYNRNNLIAKLVRKYDADICHFQECGPLTSRANDTAIQKLLSADYAEAYPKMADKNYTPVFYKKDRFSEVDSGYVLFPGKNDADSKSVTWAVLEEIKTGERIAVASTHFWWQCESEEDSLQRVENARCVKEVCDMIEEKYNLPVIVSGDLNCGINSEQGTAGYDEMVRLGMRDARKFAKETTDCFTWHEYPEFNEEKEIFENGSMPVMTIDHVFVSGNLPIEILKFDVLTEQDALDSSDHCPIISDFNI